MGSLMSKIHDEEREAVTEKRVLEGSLPAIAAQLYAALRDVPQKRLSDFFEEVSDYLLTEEGNE